MEYTRARKIFAAMLAVIVLALVVYAQDEAPSDVGTLDKEAMKGAFRKPYSPYAGRNYPTRPYFGDTHLHTMYSFDPGAFDGAQPINFFSRSPLESSLTLRVSVFRGILTRALGRTPTRSVSEETRKSIHQNAGKM
jgi:hypothetical protein